MNCTTPNVLTPDQQTLLAAWQQHTHAEFVLKDADATLATMTENPYLLMMATGTACVGRAAVREYYADHFLPAIPPDLELASLSQTIGSDRLVEEMVVRFTHTIEMDWLLPTLRPSGRRAEFIIAAVIGFEDSKVAHEHIYWDQATLLSQMGVLNHPLAAAGTGSVRQLSRLR
jgi:carboxymethylenebutenolidase